MKLHTITDDRLQNQYCGCVLRHTYPAKDKHVLVALRLASLNISNPQTINGKAG
jgi:hypothetical protein